MTKRRALMTPEERERACAQRRAAYQRKRDQELAYAATYRDANREQINAYAKARRDAGLVKGTSYYRAMQTPKQRANELAQKRRRYQENRESALAYAAEYRAKNAAVLREQWRGSYGRRKAYYDSYRAKNRDRLAARRAIWTAANRDRIAALNAEWTRNNLDRHRVYQSRRRARIKTTGGALSTNIVEILMEKQRGRCACCGQRLEQYHIDHIVPLAMGGTNADDNVQLLTPRCNLQKGSKHPVEFMQNSRGLLL